MYFVWLVAEIAIVFLRNAFYWQSLDVSNNHIYKSVAWKWRQYIPLNSSVVAWNKNSRNVVQACRKRRLKWISSARGCSWVTVSPRNINTEASSISLWSGVRLTPWPCKTNSCQETPRKRRWGGQGWNQAVPPTQWWGPSEMLVIIWKITCVIFNKTETLIQGRSETYGRTGWVNNLAPFMKLGWKFCLQLHKKWRTGDI